jgi:hypothetical protein
MESLDIIILTTVVAILFLVFILATFKEMAEEAKKPIKREKERGPRADLIDFVGRIFSDDSIEPKEKKELLKIITNSLKGVDDEASNG